MRVYSYLGDDDDTNLQPTAGASDAAYASQVAAASPAGAQAMMDAVVAGLQQQIADANTAFYTATQVPGVNYSLLQSDLNNAQLQLNVLIGLEPNVIAGTTPFSTGDSNAPGWYDTAQAQSNQLTSDLATVGKTSVTGVLSNFLTNLASNPLFAWMNPNNPNNPLKPGSAEFPWLVTGAVLLGVFLFTNLLKEGKGIAGAFKSGATAGYGSYRRRKAHRR